MSVLLSVENLKTTFYTSAGIVRAVDNVTFQIQEGQSVGLVGESGCGKSVTSLSILRLIAGPSGRIDGGHIYYKGVDVLTLDDAQMRAIRGNQISMIFQEPMTSLNPVFRIGDQISESLMLHEHINKKAAAERSVEMLRLVGIPQAARVAREYPHQLSGGMRQRAMIAMALACDPALLLADEPTTALDVTIQAQIMELMKELRTKINTSVILVSHDLGVIADFCDVIKVMYAGIIAEEGEKRDIFYHAAHPYTQGLLKSIPKINTAHKSRLVPIDGQPPDLISPPKGCPFADRCQYAMRLCRNQCPELVEVSPGHRAACWLTHPEAPKPEGYLKGASV